MEKANIDSVVEENMKLVPYVVHRYFKNDIANNYSLADEYIGIGNLALFQASLKFDESYGVQFSTYASSVIIGYIKKFKRDNLNIIRIPRSSFDEVGALLSGQKDGESIDAACERLGLSKQKIVAWQNLTLINNIDSEVPMGKDGGTKTLHDIIESDEDIENDVIDKLSREEALGILRRILSDRHLELVSLMMEDNNLNQTELGKKMGMSQAQISRMQVALSTYVAPEMQKYFNGEISFNKMVHNIRRNHKYGQCPSCPIRKDIKPEGEILVIQDKYSNRNLNEGYIGNTDYTGLLLSGLIADLKDHECDYLLRGTIEKHIEGRKMYMRIYEDMTGSQKDQLIDKVQDAHKRNSRTIKLGNLDTTEDEAVTVVCNYMKAHRGERINLSKVLAENYLGHKHAGTVKKHVYARLLNSGYPVELVVTGKKNTQLVLHEDGYVKKEEEIEIKTTETKDEIIEIEKIEDEVIEVNQEQPVNVKSNTLISGENSMSVSDSSLAGRTTQYFPEPATTLLNLQQISIKDTPTEEILELLRTSMDLFSKLQPEAKLSIYITDK